MPSLFSVLMLLPGLWGTYAGARWLLSHWYIDRADQIALSTLAALVYFTAAMVIAAGNQAKSNQR